MRKLLLLALSLLGLFDSLYLLWVYTSPSRPIVCLGSGCDAVRASAYAYPFRVPLPVFGAVNYTILALLIFAGPLVSARLAQAIRLAIAGITGAGFLFSIYLTSLEAFVIHAWCAWCVGSAIVVSSMFVLSAFGLRRPLAPTDPAAATAEVRTNFVLCVVALLVGVPAFLLLARHGELPVAPQASAQMLAEHLVHPDSHMAGNLQASLTVVEFGDFECGACGLTEKAAQELRATYGDRIRFVFRQFPISKIHPQAEKAAEASECAAQEGKFWEAVEKLYAGQADLSETALSRYAAELGLDQNRFHQCLSSGEMAARVDRDLADARALGVKGTPTFFIGQKMMMRPMDFATLSLLVNQELAGVAAATPAPASAQATTQDAPGGPAGVFGSNPGGALFGSQAAIGACSEEEANKKQPSMIGTPEVRQLLEGSPKPLPVDVRPAKEFSGGRIPGAINIPSEDFGQDWDKLPKDKTLVLYESGRSSGDICAASRAAGRALLEHGFSFDKVKVYQDGLAGWAKAGQPIEH